jgi:hypothetical protein
MTLRVESFHVTLQLQNLIFTFFIQTCVRTHNTHTQRRNAYSSTFLLVLCIGEICPPLCVTDEYWRSIIPSPRSDTMPIEMYRILEAHTVTVFHVGLSHCRLRESSSKLWYIYQTAWRHVSEDNFAMRTSYVLT